MSDAPDFAPPRNLLRLGVLETAASVLRLEHAGGTPAREVALTDRELALMARIDPTDVTTRYTPREREILARMVEEGALLVLGRESRLNDYDYVLQVDDDIVVANEPFGEGLFCVTSGGPFLLPPIGRVLLDRLDRRTPMGEHLDAIQRETMGSDAARELARNVMGSTGRSFYSHLCDAALALTHGIQRANAGRLLVPAPQG